MGWRTRTPQGSSFSSLSFIKIWTPVQCGSHPYCALPPHLPGKWTNGPSQAHSPGPLPLEDKRAGWLSSLLTPPPVQGQLPVCRDRHCYSVRGRWPSRWTSQPVPVTDIHLAKQLAGNTMRPLVKGATGRHCPQPGQARHSLSLPGFWNFPDSGHQEPSGTGRSD